MSVDQFKAVLTGALQKATAALNALAVGMAATDEARTIVGGVLKGTNDPDAGTVSGAMATAHGAMAHAYQKIANLEPTIRSYLAGIAEAASDAPRPTVDNPPLPRFGEVTPDRVERIKAALPAAVVSNTGQKTHGIWIGPDGREHTEISGMDEKHDAAVKYFESRPSARVPSRVTDVEIKLAVHVRLNGIKHTTLVINHVPCPGRMGCDSLVPVILPEGYTLTVYGANGFYRVYHGGKKSKWLP
ncbi:DddA-like double-stranded DNA deaminase toxin [Actinokineospora sp. HUAS TT18]|uniref:DddA-like double-stranded DNA deaminase toxin n=1 Tax=Actinokineospora sp. HUAS TT18 TaxID=3447451 RepID=UPI003F51AF09